MRIDLEFVELHTPLFLGDTNLGTKLYSDPKKGAKGHIEMWYETDLKHTFIVFKNHVAMIETTASKTVADHDQLKGYLIKELVKPTMFKPNTIDAQASVKSIPVKAQVEGPRMPPTPATFRSAQVETPFDRVQGVKAGSKRAKYQGEEV